MSDGAGHTWMGALDPDICAPPGCGRRLLRQHQDGWLGEILDNVGNNGTVCLVSDHGMAGVGKTFSPNAVLEKAGLLTRAADGSIDLARTRICAPPWGDYFVSINGTDWKNGIVPPSSPPPPSRHLPSPAKHWASVSAAYRRRRGDLYLDFAPGYVPTSRPGGGGAGQSVTHRRRRSRLLSAACQDAGHLLYRRRGRRAERPDTRHAPDRCRSDHRPPARHSAPRNATGHILGEVLKN